MKIILKGACGRMGKTVAELAQERSVEIACGIDLHPCPMPFPVYASLADAPTDADAVIDFSSPNGLTETLAYCTQNRTPLLLAATGYTEEDIRAIEKSARIIPVFKTGNLSVGVCLLQLLAKKAAFVLRDFDAEIIEKHHNKKKDAPSGTALMLAESVNEGFGNSKREMFGRHGIVGERDKNEIGIHAVRGGTIVGEHEVIFAGDDEILTLSHSARSRRIFATGALQSAVWLTSQRAGLYNMNHLLEGILGD